MFYSVINHDERDKQKIHFQNVISKTVFNIYQLLAYI